MAIKKGAFELYTKNGRELPKKDECTFKKKNHIFDDYKSTSLTDETYNEHSNDPVDKYNGTQTEYKRNTRQAVNIIDEGLSSGDNGTQATCSTYVVTEHKRNTKQALGIINRGISTDNNEAQTEYNAHVVTEHKRSTKSADIITSKCEASDNNGAHKDREWQGPDIRLNELSGNSRKIVISFYKNMKKLKSNSTEELTIEHIHFISGVEKNSIKTTLRRLVSNGVLSRIQRKDGRGGWVKYTISQTIFNELNE